MDSHQILVWEQRLCKKADFVFVTSKNLLNTRAEWNQCTHYLPNVVDLSYFQFSAEPDFDLTLPDLAAIPRPRLLFVGAISGYKVDFVLLRDLALLRPEWSIVLIGAVGEGDPDTDIDLLDDLHNVHFLGPKEYAVLPSYMSQCDVGLLPCLLNQYTKNMFPMKFFEYLASGLPVVSTALPSLVDFKSFYDECKSVSEFERKIENILSGRTILDISSVRNLLASNTYESRTAKMLSIIDDLVDS